MPWQKLKPSLHPLPEGVRHYSYEVMLCTWFGVGRLRPASGTIGSLAAVPFGFAINYFLGPIALIIAAAILLWFGSIAADSFTKKAGVKDHQAIVVDEVIGMWIAGIAAESNVTLWIIAFFLFRIFDIYKPWPASFFDGRGKHGYDILLDDVIAGIYALMGVATIAAYFTMSGKM